MLTTLCRVACLSAVLLVAGCAGQVKTVVLPTNGLAPGSTFSGVVFYPPQYVKQTFAFTTLLNSQGVGAGTASNDCVPAIQREVIALQPDLGRPMLLQNGSHSLSAARFSVTLDNGMLASVNAEPTQRPSDLLSATSTLVKEIGGILLVDPKAAKPACNASPRLIAFERVELK
jgi:hypothetical protein